MKNINQKHQSFFFLVFTFLGGFLLMFIQPTMGKQLLPHYGGGSMIWMTLMFAFTTLTLFGYSYSLWLSRLPNPAQRKVHLSVLLVASLIIVLTSRFQISSLFTSPTVSILFNTLVMVGLPTFILSTTSTMSQVWFSKIFKDKSPYYLYSSSNIGSFVGLIAYPFVFEPLTALSLQRLIFSIGFLIYALLLVFILSFPKDHDNHEAVKPTLLISRKSLVWLTLSFLSAFSLYAITSHVITFFVSTPFFWLFPLGLYFVSFIFAFGRIDWYSREFYATSLLFLTFISALIFAQIIYLPNIVLLSLLLITSFVVNLICAGELFRLRPATESLPSFYFLIAVGGALAAFIAGIVAPSMLPDIWEYPAILVVMCLLATVIYWKNSDLLASKIPFLLLSVLTVIFIFQNFGYLFSKTLYPDGYRLIDRNRNFYGVNRVVENTTMDGYSERRLNNGVTQHGLQLLGTENDWEPTSYYHRDTGVGYALLNHPKYISGESLNVGVVGLGAGTMAGYCRPGDSFTFFEINQAVIELSIKYFSFFSHCRNIGGQAIIIKGDARKSLEKPTEDKFDLLVIDAFSDDSIPTHLLTREAMDLYFSRLNNQGILALHISSKYLNLAPVVENYAQKNKTSTLFFEDPTATWYLLSRQNPGGQYEWTVPQAGRKSKMWTDEYSSLLPLIR